MVNDKWLIAGCPVFDQPINDGQKYHNEQDGRELITPAMRVLPFVGGGRLVADAVRDGRGGLFHFAFLALVGGRNPDAALSVRFSLQGQVAVGHRLPEVHRH